MVRPQKVSDRAQPNPRCAEVTKHEMHIFVHCRVSTLRLAQGILPDWAGLFAGASHFWCGGGEPREAQKMLPNLRTLLFFSPTCPHAEAGE